MGYLKIPNLYADTRILEEERGGSVYALEKIHGTSCHFSYKPGEKEPSVYSGGIKHDLFVAQFNLARLQSMFDRAFGPALISLIVYGEGYGGKCQAMSDVYGKETRFVAFDVKVNGRWLSVDVASACAEILGFEFVHYEKVPCTIEALNAARDKPSAQAERNGMGVQYGEGIVIRPILENRYGDDRAIAKHKRPEFSEHKTPREVTGAEIAVLADARAIADEWVTEMRLNHVIDKVLGADAPTMQKTGVVVSAMIADIEAEGASEIVISPAARRAIGHAAARLYKSRVTTIAGS